MARRCGCPCRLAAQARTRWCGASWRGMVIAPRDESTSGSNPAERAGHHDGSQLRRQPQYASSAGEVCVIRALHFAALASALGGWLAVQLAGSLALGDTTTRTLRRLTRLALAVALIAQVAMLHQHGVELLSGTQTERTIIAALMASTKTWVGRVMCAQGAVILVAFGLSWRAIAARCVTSLLLCGLACTALSGHVISGRESMPLSAAALAHVLLAALWFGGLGPLWVAHRAARAGTLPVRWAGLLQAFSKVALPTMVGVAASGLVLAWWSVGRWAALVATPYGWILLIKLAAVVVVLGLAA